MSVVAWMPLPEDDSVSIYERERWLYGAPTTALTCALPNRSMKLPASMLGCRRRPASS